MEIISFELSSNFGFFNARDNKEVNDTFLSIHPPAVLGLLGNIIGLKGFKDFNGKLEYLEKLKDIKMSIEILNKNIETKEVEFSDTNRILFKSTALFRETCLIKPRYRIRLILNHKNETHLKLKEYLLGYKSVFTQYLGKTQFITSPKKVMIESLTIDGDAKSYVGIHPKENTIYLKNRNDYELHKMKNNFIKNPFFILPTSIDYDDYSGVSYNRFDEVSFDGPFQKDLSNGLILYKENKAYYFFEIC